MTIAYLINQYPQPSHTFIRREIQALESQGWEVQRYILRPFDKPLPDLDDQEEQQRCRAVLAAGPFVILGALLQTLGTRPARFLKALRLTLRLSSRSRRGLIAHLAYLGEAALLRCWLDEAGIQHLHAHFGSNSTAVAMLCRILGGPPYSFTIHGPTEFDGPLALSLLEKIQHATFVVAITDFCRSQLFRWSRFEDWPKIKVVGCGVDSRFLEAERVPIPETNRLVTVGRLVEQKGPLILVEAAALLRDRGVDVELRLVGDGPLRDVMEARIAEKNLGETVRLLGTLDGQGVRHELQESRAMLLPSFAEGLPVVLMESMALGRPVISTYIAGIPELVRPGEEGWLVPAGSVTALADAITTVLNTDLSELEAIGRAGTERVKERHNVQTEAAKLGDFIKTYSGVSPSTNPTTVKTGSPKRDSNVGSATG